MSWSVTSWPFLGLLLLGPVLRGLRAVPYKYLHLILSAGLVLWACEGPRDVLAVTTFLLLPYWYGTKIYPRWQKLSPILLLILTAFIWLKGYTWILQPIGLAQAWSPFSLLGLSYILFRVTDYLLQLEAGTIPNPNLLEYLNFTLSYWCILSGPIERFHAFTKSFAQPVPSFHWPTVLQRTHRVANGLLKILILSSFFKDGADNAFHELSANTGGIKQFLVWWFYYPAYVYCNFSGYCDVVIGAAALSGLSLPENFQRPYLARNMIEFWNRWHISLSEWLRDYLFQPFYKFLVTGAGAAWPQGSQYLALFVTFFLVGVWHGTTINFAVFGAIHGAAMVLAVVYKAQLKSWLGKEGVKRYNEDKKISFAAWFVCQNFVCFSFLFFEYDMTQIAHAIHYLVGKYVA